MYNKLKNFENVPSLLFQIEDSNFSTKFIIQANFNQLQNFLQLADISLSEKVEDLSSKITQTQQQLIRTSGVYKLNTEKRKKQEEYLAHQRKRIQNQIASQKQRLNITINPITLVLKEKQKEISRLEKIKQIISDFDKIMKGSEGDMDKIMPLDDIHFNKSAFKIFVFKQLLQQISSPQHDLAKIFIRQKYSSLKSKITSNFKQGFIKKDIIILNNTLPYCQQYQLMQQISDYYNAEAFIQSHKIIRIQGEEVEGQIKGFFFLVQRGFIYAFGEMNNDGELNFHRIKNILSKHQDFFARRLITYVFEKIIKQSIDNVLKSSLSSDTYLKSLQIFYSQSKSLIKSQDLIIQDEKIIHLMQTYFQSIFDIYLDSYLNKELHHLNFIYEESFGVISQQLRALESFQPSQQKKQPKKFTFKKLIDYKIETKKVYSIEATKNKLKGLSNLFMEPSLQKLFEVTKYALKRNNKISKINQIDRNRNEILSVFLRELKQLVETILKSLSQTLPNFEESAAALQHEFFHIIPQINILLQRMELIYSEHVKSAKYELSQSRKLEQKKEDLIGSCQKKLNKIVGDALACILSTEKTILKQKMNYTSSYSNEAISTKIQNIIERYLKAISKISQQAYRQLLFKTIGQQFVNLLIQHYAFINYNREGLGGIYLDISGYSKILKLINDQFVDQRFNVFKSLVDIYVTKNSMKQIQLYVLNEKQGALKNQKQQSIQLYIDNKKRVEKIIE